MILKEHRREYNKIISEIINKSFPELRNFKIYAQESDKKKFELISAEVYYFGLFWRIRLSKRLREFPKKHVIAILTHELCHISIFQKRNFIKKVVFFYFLLYLKRFRTIEEKNTEILQIQKGYGRELYSFRKYDLSRRNKEIIARIKKYYLSPKEIKQYMKKLK